MPGTIGSIYEFGTFRLDTTRRLLTHGDRSVTLPPKTFDLLVLLVESGGRVYSKKELMSALWPDTFVEDANLTFQISALRKVLGSEGSEWIETLPRYGYRFGGNVLEVEVPIRPERVTPREIAEPPAAAPQPVVAEKPNSVRWPYQTAVGLLVLLAAYFAWSKYSAPSHADQTITFQVNLATGLTQPDNAVFALSPLGDKLAFIAMSADGSRRLWLRPLNSLKTEPLPGTDLADSAFWSPDGQALAFVSAGKLKRLDLNSGLSTVICDVPIARSAGSWNSQGVILFQTSENPEIYQVASTGGEPKAITHPDSANGEIRHSDPAFLPDGKHFIYFVTSQRADSTGVYLASLDTPRGNQLISSAAAGVVARRVDGSVFLLFPRGNDLMAQPLDPGDYSLEGSPSVLARRLIIALGGGLPHAAVSASMNGVLALRTLIDSGNTQLTWFDRSGKKLDAVGEPALYSNPAISPNGRKIVVSRMDPQTRSRDLWLFDEGKGVFSRFTFDPADETNAVWDPSGSRIAFNLLRNGVNDIFVKEVTGVSDSKLLLHTDDNKYLNSWTPDGKSLLYRVGSTTYSYAASGGESPSGPYPMENPQVSPDGKWVAYTSSQTGRTEVYVQRYPRAEGKSQISTSGGIEPTWRADGKELYFISADRLIAVPIETGAGSLEIGAAKRLFSVPFETVGRRARYLPASNGQRFLVNLPVDPSSPLTVTVNWPSTGLP